MDYITHNMEWEIDPKLIFLTIPVSEDISNLHLKCELKFETEKKNKKITIILKKNLTNILRK
jgi:hypothetical protein